MSTWYRLRWGEITTVEVEKETSAFVIINGRRNQKVSSWESFHPTFEAAKNREIDMRLEQVRIAQRNLNTANEALEKAKALEVMP